MEVEWLEMAALAGTLERNRELMWILGFHGYFLGGAEIFESCYNGCIGVFRGLNSFISD